MNMGNELYEAITAHYLGAANLNEGRLIVLEKILYVLGLKGRHIVDGHA